MLLTVARDLRPQRRSPNRLGRCSGDGSYPSSVADSCRRTACLTIDAPLPVPKVSNYVQLTHDGQPKALVGTDGSRLYLGFARPTVYNHHRHHADVCLGGEPVRIPASSKPFSL